jgi:hypothetical protein
VAGYPRGAWVGVRGQKRTEVGGQIFLIFFKRQMVFLNSLHQETPKNVIKPKTQNKNEEKLTSTFLSLVLVLEKVFDVDFL